MIPKNTTVGIIDIIAREVLLATFKNTSQLFPRTIFDLIYAIR